MLINEIRNKFLNFFAHNGHQIVPSSSLVPHDDPTLLFVNAGMVQFKDVFLGREHRDYVRATSSQCCVRAGGKHNDLENVGYTSRHHTFFEMLGNFSFGDYFKKEAIKYAWQFITVELGIPKDKLWVTVFTDDDEAADIWLNDIKIDPSRLNRCGEKDNFWSMGDTGPCGPCTEIFYDYGPNYSGEPPGVGEDSGDRYIEIWNLVFMQFNRDAQGVLHKLPKPSVDTGMGLERVSAVMQGVHSNYEIDLFKNIIGEIIKLHGISDHNNPSLRVIADHLRACSFLVAHGVIPSNEGRGYVLRRIMRRAIRHGQKLGITNTFFADLVPILVKVMGDTYKELRTKQTDIQRVLRREEEQFRRTLTQGLQVLETQLSTLEGKVLPGVTVFQLYDTYGFPVDLTQDILRERGLQIDNDGFENEMAKQRLRGKASSKFGVNSQQDFHTDHSSDFTGYNELTTRATILEICDGALILDTTPFYAESGGQVGDTGELTWGDNGLFIVTDTQKHNNAYLHYGELIRGTLSVGQQVNAQVNNQLRQRTACHHSATHLLHAALRKILGTHVQQKGSLVAPDRLRFDFTHDGALTAEQLNAVEAEVNARIWENSPVQITTMTLEDAMASGAMALFGEKYSGEVRVITMGDSFSVELCGGTHVKNTGDIGLFVITQETGIANGVRRIEALTQEVGFNYLKNYSIQLANLSNQLKTKIELVPQKIEQLLLNQREQDKKIAQLTKQLAIGGSSAGADADNWQQQVQEVNGIKVLAYKLAFGDIKMLRELADQYKNKLGDAVVVLALVTPDNKIQLVVSVTKKISKQYPAGELMKYLTSQIDGSGGGRDDMAQGGGDRVDNLEKMLSTVIVWIKDKM